MITNLVNDRAKCGHYETAFIQDNETMEATSQRIQSANCRHCQHIAAMDKKYRPAMVQLFVALHGWR